MLRVDNLTRSYGKLKALDSVSFNAEAGEVLGFLGPNGAGKSTAMKIITGYLAADSGQVFVEDLEVHEHPLKTREVIGALPEHNPLYDDMEAREYLHFCGQMRGMKRSERVAAIARAADEVGLTPMLPKPIRELSRGYRQRTGFAAALLHDPSLLILDEPTSGLDPTQIVEIHALLRGLAGRGKAVVFSTHILSEVEAVADQLVILNRGKVLAHGRLPEVSKQAHVAPRMRIVTGAPLTQSLRTKLESLDGVTDFSPSADGSISLRLESGVSNEIGGQVFSLLGEAKAEVRELRYEAADLDHAFRALVAQNNTQDQSALGVQHKKSRAPS